MGFSTPHIVLTAVVAAVAAYALLRRLAREMPKRDAIGIGIHVGVATLALRFFANVPALNDDFLPAISVNDLLGFPVALVASLVYWAYWPLGGKRPSFERAWHWGLLLGVLGFLVTVVII